MSSLPTWEANRALLHALRGAGYGGRVAVAVRDAVDEAALTSADVQLVFRPFVDAADHAAETVLRSLAADGPAARAEA